MAHSAAKRAPGRLSPRSANVFNYKERTGCKSHRLLHTVHQHQADLPNRRSILIPKMSANAGKSEMSGQQTARSHFDTACAETPRRVAKASCVIPVRRRKTASLSPNSVVNCILRLLFWTYRITLGRVLRLPFNLRYVRGEDAQHCLISGTEFYRATSGREFPRTRRIIAHPMLFLLALFKTIASFLPNFRQSPCCRIYIL